MGKCKKRTLNRRSATPYFMTRETAVNNVFRMFNDNKKRDKNDGNRNKKS